MFEFDLPSGRKVTMKVLNFSDRQEAFRWVAQHRSEGIGAEDYMAALALVRVNNVDIAARLMDDPVDFVRDWELTDYQFYLEVFMSINSLDEKGRKAAEDVAKKLMKGQEPAKVAKS